MLMIERESILNTLNTDMCANSTLYLTSSCQLLHGLPFSTLIPEENTA